MQITRVGDVDIMTTSLSFHCSTTLISYIWSTPRVILVHQCDRFAMHTNASLDSFNIKMIAW
jgi:hypothetical protein